jgi:hypothetical protein
VLSPYSVSVTTAPSRSWWPGVRRAKSMRFLSCGSRRCAGSMRGGASGSGLASRTVPRESGLGEADAQHRSRGGRSGVGSEWTRREDVQVRSGRMRAGEGNHRLVTGGPPRLGRGRQGDRGERMINEMARLRREGLPVLRYRARPSEAGQRLGPNAGGGLKRGGGAVGRLVAGTAFGVAGCVCGSWSRIRHQRAAAG